MSDDLIQEMSSRLGRTAPEVEKAFAAFASAVQDRVRSDGEANLAGLGVIRREAGGARFEASAALSQAVNYRWLSPGAPVASASGRPEAKLSVVPPMADAEPKPMAGEQDSEPAKGQIESPGLDVDIEPPDLAPTPGTDTSAPRSVDLSPELLEEPPMPDDQKPIRKVSWAPIGEVDPTDLTSSPTPPAPKAATSKPAAKPATPPAKPATPATKTAAPAAKPTPPAPKTAAPAAKFAPKPADPAQARPASSRPPSEAFMPPVAPPMPPAAGPPPPPIRSEDALVDDLTYESLHQQPEAPGSAAVAAGAAVRSSKAGSRRPPSSRRSGQTEASSRKPLFIVLGLVALVAIGWILVNQFGGGSDSADPAVAGTEATSTNPAEGPENPEVDPAEETTDPGTETSQPAPPVAPATANSIDPNSSGYTLIVGSSLSRSGAETEMNRFRNLGHPVALLSYPDGDGQTRHRIAVGEFATANAADSARRAMASRLPDGTWVRRIRR